MQFFNYYFLFTINNFAVGDDLICSTSCKGFPFGKGIVAMTTVDGCNRICLTATSNFLLKSSILPISSIMKHFTGFCKQTIVNFRYILYQVHLLKMKFGKVLYKMN